MPIIDDDYIDAVISLRRTEAIRKEIGEELSGEMEVTFAGMYTENFLFDWSEYLGVSSFDRYIFQSKRKRIIDENPF